MATTLQQLQAWIDGKEGEHLVFKKAKNRYDFDELVKYCCALANEGGGKMVLGVSDKRPRQVVGTNAFDQPERTRNGLCQRLPLRLDFDEIRHPAGRVLVFHVPARPVGTAIQDKGIYWARQTDSLAPLSPDRLRDIFAEIGHDFSADVCPAASSVDLDPLAIEDFRRRWSEKQKRAGNNDAAQRDSNALPGPGSCGHGGGDRDGRPTYAALALFGTHQALGRHLAQAEVLFEYRSSDASGPAAVHREYRQGFFSFYDDLLAHWSISGTTYSTSRMVYSSWTFRHSVSAQFEEAALNAVSHRDYQLGGSTFVRQYPRRLEIDSPGGLPVGITLDNILDRQNPRNRRIADIFTKCGLVERSGQGMNLIFEEAIRQSKPTPDFSQTDRYQVALTLQGTVEDPNFLRFLEKVGQEKTTTFSTHDWLILSHIARGEKIPDAYKCRLGRLADLGVIERSGGRKLHAGHGSY